MNVKAILTKKKAAMSSRLVRRPPFADVAKVLHERRIGAGVVVDDSRRIVGIIAERDIVGAIAITARHVCCGPSLMLCGRMSIAAPKT